MTIAEIIGSMKSLKMTMETEAYIPVIDAVQEILTAVSAEGITSIDDLLDTLNDAKQIGLAYESIAPLHVPGRPVYSDGVIHCPKCNGRIHTMWSYCNKCGKKLSW